MDCARSDGLDFLWQAAITFLEIAIEANLKSKRTELERSPIDVPRAMGSRERKALSGGG